MANIERCLLPPTATIREAVTALEAGEEKIVVVVDAGRRLLGTVTDGDIRRGILRGHGLDDPVAEVMFRKPDWAPMDARREAMLGILAAAQKRQLPLLDAEGRVVDVKLIDELVPPRRPDNWVVLMAGGLGTRLRPLTQEAPKPLLTVGSRPILEIIVSALARAGFSRFFISVNYKAAMVKAHFGDGARFGVRIDYLEEKAALGTAGALSLLPERPTRPLLVMNADLLTKLDFNHLLDFHAESGAEATMCVREFHFQVPYGVVEIDGQRILGIEEKPEHRFFVNAGIYMLNPGALELLPCGEAIDMTDVFARLIAGGRRTAAFPIREYWLDVGRPDDLKQASSDLDLFAED
ncbi:MAG: nucleotidyltransferase family protein [Proteobacteria bacterium]|nr:nucleotidyltransferase family protein [Pseudomonadota bacterium]